MVQSEVRLSARSLTVVAHRPARVAVRDRLRDLLPTANIAPHSINNGTRQREKKIPTYANCLTAHMPCAARLSQVAPTRPPAATTIEALSSFSPILVYSRR